ncbi:hypothetical protein ACFFH2_08420 [Enterococcus devriesei]|uniref:Uncharacterized protein n=1 Tax=Enterococcus devriesei TaxID=319970 RepID=A0A1L8SVS9_9ENTE|nr:hypothetical protein [Enterococcus devriesei]OJG36125.1 hypothetical protein RV00_GL002269 [Enterococcus devriesei]
MEKIKKAFAVKFFGENQQKAERRAYKAFYYLQFYHKTGWSVNDE